MNKIWIGTNWKMTKTIAEGLSYTEELKRIAETLTTDIELFIIPSHTSLMPIKNTLGNSRIHLGTQNMHWEDAGAYTGEISPRMLNEIGIDIIELGHSERRQYYNENDEDINKKVHAGLRYGMKPIVCIGENISQKNSGISKETLAAQLEGCLKGITEDEAAKMMIAYEPVWAIGGSGIPAPKEYVAEIHGFLRQTLVRTFGEAGKKITLLFGGSVNRDNFLKYSTIPDVDGLFIGRAAWDIKSFREILTQLEFQLN